MKIIEFWRDISDIERIPFLAERWYILPLIAGVIIFILIRSSDSGEKSSYIHVSSNKSSCSTCRYYIPNGHRCTMHGCGINRPNKKTCDYYMEDF